jgi:hypothetical protein
MQIILFRNIFSSNKNKEVGAHGFQGPFTRSNEHRKKDRKNKLKKERKKERIKERERERERNFQV